MLRGAIVLVAFVFALPALASQPGHPLDCSDWVFGEPGLSCEVRLPTGSCTPCSLVTERRVGSVVVDNDGRILRVTRDTGIGTCGAGQETVPLFRTRVLAVVGSTEIEVAHIDDRCARTAPGAEDFARPSGGALDGGILFDAVRGQVLVPLHTSCNDNAGGCQYQDGDYLAALIGFTPLFEILQTYTPTADALQFRVPAHPEGLRSADHFDTYWGHVTDLPDFTQAQPMACHYPPSPPAAGDYLTVADTSPAPPPGAANYTVTAVSYQGQRRYGRKLINGVLSGRNPALLPGCP